MAMRATRMPFPSRPVWSWPRLSRTVRGGVVLAVLAVVVGGTWFGASAVASAAAVAELDAGPGSAVVSSPAALETHRPAEAAVLAQGGDSGPELDPQTEADQENAQSKLVVGLVAAALLGIIVWGRIVRRKRAKKDD